ncbi:c-type cytochrome biogenesis protein CcmI [Solemya pervernicosa gill symbiont]|uniref:C-type cytochrome biogenesis protein CcmI n=2 Tax=Gammaproteobacteria incertae sedis TaxID=118884 RepID=A0A1T2L266_9GAMM|nr:c-type cytochrome biogenesis protein CcmI [Candidatus Reidiella endopervernicosa]OOZ39036.1 c-type cytochrome biogenesis protein CcmI [Solemya pervernicosa gill symbiont]QKQ27686.1 c-type cytochrome biogenesis protein CcmI [Candidatus Reidiella endopervernicosa]
MITFWLLIAGMTIAALLFVVPPLLGRGTADAAQRRELNITIYHERLAELEAAQAAGDLEQETFDAANSELEHELLYDISEKSEDAPVEQAAAGSSRVTAIAVALFTPILAIAFYLQLGSHRLIPFLNAPETQQAQASGNNGEAIGNLDDMIVRLEKRMEATPDDMQGWVMLGRSYMELERYDDAVKAYARAVSINGEIGAVLVDYAEALGVANGGDLRGKPTEILNKAVKLDPEVEKGLWLAGVAGYQDGNFAVAVEHWRKLTTMIEPGTEMGNMIAESLSKAEAELNPEQHSQMAAAHPAPAAATPAATEGATVSVSVTLDSTLQALAAPGDTLFVYARAAQGPRMPLAIVRKQASDLPITVTLSDAQAMMAEMKLSSFPQVVIGARLSKSGQAIAQSGDLEGVSDPLDPNGTDSIAISIDQIRP